MKKLLSLFTVFLFVLSAAGQKKYEGNWKSLDSRPNPQWWGDAKFGIFIHFGVYSVPSFSKVGQYSEWYWNTLVNQKARGHQEVKNFHDKNFGERFTYPDFVPQFTCELFNPEQWAKLFEESGAKYVILTSKHHDGYCLWPSSEADKSWGRPWNSLNSGPGIDILGELTSAVRKTDVKMGFYYSLYEWYNPLYKADVNLYVEKHMFPQFKDLVQRYSPSVIFSDGEWDHADTTWRAPELLAWLFNDSPSKDDVVINDRWGKGIRHKHGGYFTTEYGSGLPDATNPWEENRGMAYSFGYNRAENLEDYNTSQSLIYMLIDIVSRGGNFNLDIGPSKDGLIPVIMQERLIDIGQWLKVNGESIYGTTCWKNTCQWSKGKVQDAERGEYMVKYDIMKLTVNPDPGIAAKEILFTRKGNTLYCICPVFPDKKLVVRDVRAASGARITMLGIDKPLQWKQVGANLEIIVPGMNPSMMPCKYAYTFKISEVKQ